MSFSFHPRAEKEFNEAIDYYEDVRPGLGCELALEVHSTIENVLKHPQAWMLLEYDVRRALVRRFPYAVLYSQEPQALFIIAIMNLRREPGYWKNRIGRYLN